MASVPNRFDREQLAGFPKKIKSILEDRLQQVYGSMIFTESVRVKIINILNIFLFIGIIFSLASFVSDYLANRYTLQGDKIELPKDESHVSELKPKKEFHDYAPIIENGLFAPPDKLTFMDASAHYANLRQENPVEIPLNLRGTIIMPSKKSYAIFEDIKLKKQEVFKESEQVFNMGILNKVEKDRAYIVAGGRTIPFSMPMEAVRDSTGIVQSIVPEGQNSPSHLPVISQKVGEREWIIDKRMLSKTLEDMSKVLTDGRLLPYKEGDKIIGFRVSEIKPEGVFSLIGLQNGDILLKVNNYEIDSPEKGVQLLTGLKGESNIALDIIRNGQRVNMNYQIR